MWAELGDQRPMELMEVMLTALLLGSQSGKLLKVIFLHQIPKNLKDLDAVQFQKLEAIELAMFADIIWDARSSKKVVVAAVRTPPLRRTPLLRRRQPWRRQEQPSTSSARRGGSLDAAGAVASV